MSTEEELEHVKNEYPKAWKFFHQSPEQELPQFDDNDDVIPEGGKEK